MRTAFRSRPGVGRVGAETPAALRPAFPTHAPGHLPPIGGDHIPGPELPADISVIPLAVEFGIGQHQPEARLVGSRFHPGGQSPTVVPWTALHALREENLLIQIRHDHPLQPMPPRQGFLPIMMQASHKVRADRSLGQAGGIDGHPSPRRSWPRPPGMRRTVSPTARSRLGPSSRLRKRYKVVKSGTLFNPRVWRSSLCSLNGEDPQVAFKMVICDQIQPIVHVPEPVRINLALDGPFLMHGTVRDARRQPVEHGPRERLDDPLRAAVVFEPETRNRNPLAQPAEEPEALWRKLRA